MSETPLIDQLNELGPAGRDLLNASRAFVHQADQELRLLERRARRELLDERVALFFEENPAATANAAARAFKGEFWRNDVLDAVAQIRTPRTADTAADVSDEAA